MATLNARQRVKINAALALIHDLGHNPHIVSRSARSDVARGLDAKRAYELALTEFVKGKPEVARALSHTLRLIDASDDATVTQYGEALDRYNQTGDPQAMASVAKTFVQDSIALAVRNGEISPNDAAKAHGVAGAFGFPFGEGAAERVIAMAGYGDAAPSVNPQPSAGHGVPQPSQSSASGENPGWTYTASKDRSAAAFKPITGPENSSQGATY